MSSLYDLTHSTPVERSFYESLILQDRWTAGRLYASNLFQSQKFRKEVKHLARERQTELHKLDREIETLRKMIRKLDEEKYDLKYLPLKKHRSLPDIRKSATVVADIRKPSVVVPPSVYQTTQNIRQKTNRKTEKKRKPLHLPKLPRTKITELTRSAKMEFKQDQEQSEYSSIKDGQSTVSRKSEMLSINYDGFNLPRLRAHSLQPRRFPLTRDELNRSRAKSLQSLNSSHQHDITKNSIVSSSGYICGNISSRNYNDFYSELDFSGTTAKYVQRSRKSNDVSNNLPRIIF